MDSPKKRTAPRDNGPRCQATRRDGERCTNPAMVGLTVCQNHGGKTRQARRANERAKLEREIRPKLAGFTTPLDANDKLAHPLAAADYNIRLSMARIEFCNEQIAKLKEENDLVWGKAKEEHVNATEFAGINKTYEARVNVWITLQNQEREMLHKWYATISKNALDAKRIEANDVTRKYTNRVLRVVLRAFGLDPNDDAVRSRVAEALRDASPEPMAAIPRRQ